MRVYIARAFDATMFATVAFLAQHPHLVLGTCVAGLAVGAGVFALGLVGTLKAKRGAE